VDRFVVAENPDPDSSLPYLLLLPIEGGLALKAKDDWPRAARVYCHRVDGPWPDDAPVLAEVPVKVCRRRGSAIDLVLDRRSNQRSQFVFTRLRGREAIFWQTPKAARAARPGVRLPRAPDRRPGGTRDHRRHPRALPLPLRRSARDDGPPRPRGGRLRGHGGRCGRRRRGAQDRRRLPVLAVDGSLSFLMAELSALPAAAVVVEDRYSSMLRSEHVEPGWLAELVARVQVRFASVPVVFCESRKYAEEWTYRFLGTAYAELGLPIEEAMDDGEESRLDGGEGDAGGNLTP
jgi:hypothetical protein